MSTLHTVSDSLVVRSLRKRYGGRPVLDRIDMTIPAGSVTAVTGSNGCGKSTLLRCVAGTASFTGTVTFHGSPIVEVKDRLGYLPQSVALPTWATVGETIAFFARLRGADPGELGLPEGFIPDLDRQVGVLSGGQRQRVALAVALLGGPSLLLLDEPFTNLDDASRTALWAVLADIAASGGTVLVATPIEADLAGLAHSVLEIIDGHLAHPASRVRWQGRHDGGTGLSLAGEAG